jgi:hypothetical protein
LETSQSKKTSRQVTRRLSWTIIADFFVAFPGHRQDDLVVDDHEEHLADPQGHLPYAAP